MALSYDWSETEAWRNPFTLEKHHLYYDTIMASVEDDDSNWRKDEETGDIVCTPPILEAMTWWAMSMDLCGVTEKNVDEWLFRIRYARRVGWFVRQQGLIEEWTEEGWSTRPITRKDMESVVGLKVNVATISRSKWLRRVQQRIVAEIESEVSNG